MLNVGIMGGTFDPIHFGHLAAAEAAIQIAGLDFVLFLPNRLPPHKEGRLTSASVHRRAMVELAIAGNPRFQLSDLELQREGPSYTVDTARALAAGHPDRRLSFLVGMDSLLEIQTWKEHRTLLTLVDFLVVTRPGYSREQQGAAMAELGPDLTARIRILEVPGVAVSAAELRRLVAIGYSLRYLVPDTVSRYIQENGLYTCADGGGARG